MMSNVLLLDLLDVEHYAEIISLTRDTKFFPY